MCQEWLKYAGCPKCADSGVASVASTSRCADSEGPGMLRSRLVLATFLVVTCAACSQNEASPAAVSQPGSDHVGALGADVFCST